MNELVGRADVLGNAHRDTIATTLRFLETLGKGDMESLVGQWHDEGRLEFPFAPDRRPPVEGIEDIRRYFLGTRGYKKPHGFPIKAIYPGADPEWAVIEFHGNLTNTRTGKDYMNEYIAVVRVQDGKVRLFREFFDSVTRLENEG